MFGLVILCLVCSRFFVCFISLWVFNCLDSVVILFFNVVIFLNWLIVNLIVGIRLLMLKGFIRYVIVLVLCVCLIRLCWLNVVSIMIGVICLLVILDVVLILF